MFFMSDSDSSEEESRKHLIVQRRLIRQKSDIFQLPDEIVTFATGDAGYPLEPYLMTPYRSVAAQSAEAVYNTKHAKARNIVERTIGVLKNRFRCLLGTRQLHYKPAKAIKIANVCAALHNVCIDYGVHTRK